MIEPSDGRDIHIPIQRGRGLSVGVLDSEPPAGQLAFDAEVDRSYVGGLERREENPTVDVLDRLAAANAMPTIIEPGDQSREASCAN
jgi:hypothetical protein